MTSSNAKAPALGGVTGAIGTKSFKNRNELVASSIAHQEQDFDPTFDISTTHARIYIEPGHASHDEVRLSDDSESHLRLSPSEALSVAAALQAVAVHLLEEPKQLRRSTEPGAPAFEEAI